MNCHAFFHFAEARKRFDEQQAKKAVKAAVVGGLQPPPERKKKRCTAITKARTRCRCASNGEDHLCATHRACGYTVPAPAPPALAHEEPKKPLSWWQEMLRNTGRLLTDNEVELHPGVTDDVRLLSVFCSFVRKATLDVMGDFPLSDEHTLALARSWHAAGGRAGLSDPEAIPRWFFHAMPPPPRS